MQIFLQFRIQSLSLPPKGKLSKVGTELTTNPRVVSNNRAGAMKKDESQASINERGEKNPGCLFEIESLAESFSSLCSPSCCCCCCSRCCHPFDLGLDSLSACQTQSQNFLHRPGEELILLGSVREARPSLSTKQSSRGGSFSSLPGTFDGRSEGH